jgi:PilZ domain-containing protein
MKNLSLSGAFMNTDCDLRIHTVIEVRIALPPPSSCTAVIKAHVVRKIEGGVGIEWSEFAPNIIRDLVRSASRIHPRCTPAAD